MPRAPSTNTDAEWASAFALMVAQKERRPPGDGWKTRPELVFMMGRGQSYVFRVLGRAVKEGGVEKFSGCVKGLNGKMGKQVWYRPVMPKGITQKDDKAGKL